MDITGYKTEEDVKIWSEKIIELLNDKEKLKEMSENSYKYAKKFSLEAMAGHAVKVYMESINDLKKECV